MKALSFRQPWAELILQGRKTLDLRTYSRSHRGALAIHAAQTVEREACLKHGLNPDALTTGAVVGTVDVVDVVALSEVDYDARRSEHLAGRRYRAPMYGWVLENPQRLPEPIPARGRQSLFEIPWEEESPVQSPQPVERKPLRPAARALPETDAGDKILGPTRPFELRVAPANGGRDAFTLTLRQRTTAEPDIDALRYDGKLPRLTSVAALGGDTLRTVAGQVMEALRDAGYKATDLGPTRAAPFYLPEGTGVRLGLLFLAVKPLSKLSRVEAVAHGIRYMPDEEAYYWYSKCTARDTGERAQKALRVLLAAE